MGRIVFHVLFTYAVLGRCTVVYCRERVTPVPAGRCVLPSRLPYPGNVCKSGATRPVGWGTGRVSLHRTVALVQYLLGRPSVWQGPPQNWSFIHPLLTTQNTR